jgi:DNA-binding GntR family transcriptional regulator
MEGIITFERNKGITVSKLSVLEVEEIYRLRWLLESCAARWASEKTTKEQVAYLKELHKKMKAAAKKNDFEDWLRNNTLFHNFFIEKSGNRNLRQMIESVNRRIYRYKFITVRIPGHFGEYIKHHEGVLKGCEVNDGEMAKKNMRLHIESIRSSWWII